MLGVVLTNTKNIKTYVQALRLNGYSTAKIVTGWGIGKAWDHASITYLLNNTQHVIVRTCAGDPSYSLAPWYPDTNAVMQELEPWARVRRNIMVEIGNEPDVISSRHGYSEHDVWTYKWYLDNTITEIRKKYPNIRIIAPSPRVNAIPQWQRWIGIMYDTLLKADMLSAHIYGWHNLTMNWTDTMQYIRLRQVYDVLFPNKRVMITECGIHDIQQSPQEKIAKYHEFYLKLPFHWRGMTYYHYNEAKDIDPEYAVLP